ncbi:MAG: PAS domain S-box protein [Burkholderiales bacterium]
MSAEETRNLALAIVEQVADTIIFADRQGVIRLWNPAAEAVFGFSADEMIGQSLDLIIQERLRPAHWKAFHQAIEAGRTRLGRRALITRSVHKSGARLYVDLSFAIVRDAAGEVAGAVAVARDATDRYTSETTMKKRLAELEKRDAR